MQTFTLKNADAGEAARTLNEVYNPGEAMKAQQAMYRRRRWVSSGRAPRSGRCPGVDPGGRGDADQLGDRDRQRGEPRGDPEDGRAARPARLVDGEGEVLLAAATRTRIAVAKFINDLFAESATPRAQPSRGGRGQLYVYDMYGRMVPHNDGRARRSRCGSWRIRGPTSWWSRRASSVW